MQIPGFKWRVNRFLFFSFCLHASLFVVFERMNPIAEPSDSAVSVSFYEVYDSKSENRSKRNAIKPNLNVPSDTGSRREQEISKNSSEPLRQEESGASSSEEFAIGEANGNYLERVRSKIQLHKIYPKASKVFKESGLVKVRVELIKSGQIQKIEILESSQFKRLDEAALKAVADAAPFEEFPSEVRHSKWSILVPMRFELN